MGKNMAVMNKSRVFSELIGGNMEVIALGSVYFLVVIRFGPSNTVL
jgi:hypothetical protein